MRILPVFLALALTSSISHAESCPPNSDEISTTPIIEQTPRRLSMAREYSLITGSPDVLIIGDSIAEGWKKTQERDFPSRVVVNMGLVGEKTQELRWRLKEERPQILPKSVILIIGTNNFFDGKHSPCDVLGGIEAVESDIRSLWPDAKLYVMPIFPEGEDFSHREVDRKFINQELSLSSSGATAVSVDEEALTCRGKAIGCANYRPDHIHPTPSGYIILREGLADAGL